MVFRPWGCGSKGSVSKVEASYLQVQFVYPVEVVQHEAGAKPDCAPVPKIAVDLNRAPTELVSRKKQFAVVVEVVDADFESVGFNTPAELKRDTVRAFGNEV